MTVFTDLEAAFEELEFMVQQTGRVYLLKHHTLGKYKVVREYINSDDGTILARMSPVRVRKFPTVQHIIGRAA
jgi:hypothetical protein